MLGDKHIFIVASGLLILSIGVGALFFGLHNLQRVPAFIFRTIGTRLASRHWPAASGTIIGAEILVIPDASGEPLYQALVRYAYIVEGQRYEAMQDDLTVVSNSRDLAQAVIARYPISDSVPVYYDPLAPQRTLIDRRVRWDHLVGLLLAGLLFPLLLAGSLLAILTGLAMLVIPSFPG